MDLVPADPPEMGWIGQAEVNRPCLQAGCPEYATHRGRCQRHAKQRERSIERKGRKVYNSKRWAMLRRKKLGQDPICERCEKVLATDVHHKHGVQQDPWSLDGLTSLCRSCHSQVHRA